MNIATIRDNLQARLAGQIAATRWFDVWPNVIKTPAGIVERIAGPDREVLGASGPYRLRLQVVLLVGPSSDVKRSRDKLDPYLATSGGQSVRAALEGDSTLGGTIEKLIIGEATDDNRIEANGNQYVGAVVPVDVWAT